MPNLNVDVLIAGKDNASRAVDGVTKSLGLLSTAGGGAGGVVSGLITGLGRLGLAAGGLGALADGARGLGNALGLGLASEMEQVRTQFLAFTKDAGLTDQLLKQVRQEADRTPFSFRELAAATASLVPASKAARVPLEDLQKTAEILAASNPAQGLEGAALALREAVSGDFVSVVERFNLPRQRINELRDQGVPALKAVQTAMSELGLDASLVAGMAETGAGKWSTLLDTIDSIKLSVATPIFEALKGGLGEVQTILTANQATLQEWGRVVGETIGAGIRWLATNVPPAIALLTSEFEKLRPVIQPIVDVFPDLLTAGKQAVAFFGNAGGDIEVFRGVLNRLLGPTGAQGVITVFTNVAGFFRDTVQPALLSLAGVAKQVFDGDFKGALAALGTHIATFTPKLIETLADWGAKLIEWVAPMIPPLLEQAGILAGKLLTWIGEQAPAILAKLGEWGEKLWTWVEPMIPPLLTKAGELAARLLAWVGEQAPILADKLVTEWLPAALKWANEATVKLLPELEKFLTGALQWLQEKAPIVAEKFVSEWQPKFYEWVAGAAVKILPELVKLNLTIVAWIIEAGPKLALEAAKLGLAIVQGIWAGMSGQLDWLKRKAAELATAMLESAKTALGIKSPSLVFATEVGVPIVEGIEHGLAAAWPRLQAELARGIQGLVTDAAAGASAVETVLSGGTGGGGSGGGGSEPRNGDGQSAPGQYQSDPLYRQLAGNKQHGNVPGRLSMDFGDGISYDAAADTYRGLRKPHPGKSGYYSVWYRVNSLLTAGHATSVREALRMAVGWVQDNTDDQHDAALGWSLARRAAGGPVAAGRPYWVGERGPEVFVPTAHGQIVPNRAAGGLVVNVHVAGSVVSERDLVDAVHAGLLRKRQLVSTLGLA